MTSSLIYLLGLMVVCNAQYEEFEADEEGGEFLLLLCMTIDDVTSTEYADNVCKTV